MNCTGLTGINYPAGLERMIDYNGNTVTNSSYYSPFRGCTGIEEIELPEGVTAIPASMFNGANSLKKIGLPETLTAIGDYAFANTSGL